MLTDKAGHRTNPYAATIGMWIFLAALGMLFAASLLGYGLIRFSGARSPEIGAIRGEFPVGLWLSTLLVLGASVTIQFAVKAVRRERQRELRRWLVATCALAVLFILVQAPSLWRLYEVHRSMVPSGLGQSTTSPFVVQSTGPPLRGAITPLYGLIFFMVLLHALHVVGGVVGLAMVTAKGFAGAYDHEHYNGVKHAAMYWHFLDVVWMVMFLGMYALG